MTSLKHEILELGSRLRMQVDDLIRASSESEAAESSRKERKENESSSSHGSGLGHTDDSERISNARKHYKFALKVDILQRENHDCKAQLTELTQLVSKKDQKISELLGCLKKEATDFEAKKAEMQNLIDRKNLEEI